MATLVNNLINVTSDIKFVEGKDFSWSPANKTIFYDKKVLAKTYGEWSLLHETGHALLDHRDYDLDINLLLMEVAAWQKAKELAKTLDITIDEDHIQDCLDTYRDWLHKRSICPRCGIVSLQVSSTHYQCTNCSCRWRVSSSRFCRPYRRLSIEKLVV